MTSQNIAADALALTPLTLDDVPRATALLQAVEEVERHGEPVQEQGVRERFTAPGLDLARDTVALRSDGELIACGSVDVATSLDRDGRARCNLMAAVHPEHRGRGLGGRILERLEQRALELAAQRHPEAPAVLRAEGGRDPREGQQDLREGGADVRPLLEGRGYERARSWRVMVRPVPGEPIAVPQIEGVALRAPEPAEAEAVRLAHVAAFADHWGSAPISPERWQTFWTSHTARRELSTVAADAAGRILAYALTTEDTPGELHIALVGTRPEARGRGLARAVIARTVDAAAGAQLRSATLEVDAESLTGATRLYEGLGFATDEVYATYERVVRHGADV